MTPDLMEEGARRVSRPLAAAAAPAQHRVRRPRGRLRAASRSPGEVDVTHGRILYLEDVSVSFDGFKAINKLSLDIAPGELRCIIGPNGAGKTTMMDIITGKTRPDAGTVFFGSTIDLLRYNEAADRADGHRPQVPEADGVRAAHGVREPGAGAQDRQGRASPRCSSGSIRRRATAWPRCCTPSTWPTACTRLAGNLSHGQKQWLEIGMLLMQDPKLLLLDEPVAGMTDEETARTAELFLTLKGQHSLMVVEHDMSFIKTHLGDRHGAVRRLGAGPGHAGPGAER